MRVHHRNRLLCFAVLAALALGQYSGASSAVAGTTAYPLATSSFAHGAFERTWDRTDRPVSLGQVSRSFYWGPTPNTGGLLEDFLEGPGGKRLVQYFDKGRMEINNPSANSDDPFFVTSGLLTVELISGRMQVGKNTYVSRQPAAIPLASDTDDPNAPTYVSFQGVSNTTLGDHPAPNKNGQFATATINRAGQVGDNAAYANFPDTDFVYSDPVTHHNVPKAIWDFLNAGGPVFDSATGQTVNGQLSDPWYKATGLPISEPYWAKVKIANQPNQDVLIQAFERRVVTYAPSAPADFRVQMGNIGQHYHDWRYGSSPQPLPSPTSPIVPTPTAAATSIPQPMRPNSDFAGTWLNDNENTKEVSKLWIDVPDEHSLKVTWFSPCGDSVCANEGKIAPYSGEPFNITLDGRLFSLSFGDAQATKLTVGFGDGALLFHRVLARDYFGTWLNDDAASTTVGKLWITNDDASMTVKWFGVCSPGFCSNSSKTNDYDGEPFRVNMDGHTFTITCDNAGCSKLGVRFDNKALKFHLVTARGFTGTWNNVDPHSDGVVKMVITSSGSTVHVHLYTACTPNPCDNGTVSDRYSTEPLEIEGSTYKLALTFDNVAGTELKLIFSENGHPDRTYYFLKQP